MRSTLYFSILQALLILPSLLTISSLAQISALAQEGENDSSNEQEEYAAPEVEESPFDDAVSITEDDIVTLNILGNDRAFLGRDTHPQIVEMTEPKSGQIIGNSDGTVTYTPSQIQLPSGYEKVDTMQYTAYADGITAYTGTITIWTQQTNDPPVAYSANYTIKENVETTFYLGAFDEDSDSLTYEVLSGPEFGQIELGPNTGRLVYFPLYEYSGKEYITFQVSDGTATSNVATIVIEVREVGGESSPATLDDFDHEQEEFQEPLPEDQEPLPDSAGAGEDTPDENTEPVADAGNDFDALTGDLVTLDGSQSDDADGDALTFLWSQKSGPDVTLENADTPEPTFYAPEVTSETDISFDLAVNDGNSTDTASVTVTLVPISIDIIPNIYPNVIVLSEPETEIPVALHGGSALDVSLGVDDSDLALGPSSASPVWFELTDVNGDGYVDHVSYYRTGDLGLSTTHKTACLSGQVESQNGVTVDFSICKNVKVKP